MRGLYLSTVALIALGLPGCASKAPPAIAYDDEEFMVAIVEPVPPAPVEVVTVPQALPLPGQLKAIPSAAREEELPPLDHVMEQQINAALEPNDGKTINAITVYPFVDGALYQVYAAPEQVTDIALQPGEALQSVAAGDTVRWVVGDALSGAGEGEQVHILVKPFAAELETNLVILTDRRAYHLQLASTEETAMAALSWTYPQDALLALVRRNQAAESQAPIDIGVDLANLRFRYAIEGDNPPWRPLRAFDDGKKVYIAFPRRIDQGEAPPLFVVGGNGEPALVNYRVRQNYYIVDRLFAAAELRLGEEPQQIVRIVRTDARMEMPHVRPPVMDIQQRRDR